MPAFTSASLSNVDAMKVLIIAPHPDDECLGCGGSVALHVGRGDDIAAVFLTSGELGLKKLSRESAWQMRETEARTACAILGIAELSFLRLPDWRIGDDISTATDALRPVL